jgi:hypothetical protein
MPSASQHLLAACALLECGLGMNGDAIVATDRDNDRERNEVLGLAVESFGLGCGLCDGRAKAFIT